MQPPTQKPAPLAQPKPTVPTTPTQPAVAPGDKTQKAQVVPAEAIQLCAYRKWESAGKPTGEDIRFWLEAEQELVQQSRQQLSGH